MSYFTSLYKTAIDSLIKGYVDAVREQQQQQTIIPEDLVLAVGDPMSNVGNTAFNASEFLVYHRLVTYNAIYDFNQTFFSDTNVDRIGGSRAYDPICQSLGGFYIHTPEMGPVKANKLISTTGDVIKDYATLANYYENPNGVQVDITPSTSAKYFGQTIGDVMVFNFDYIDKVQNIKSFDSNYLPNNLYKLQPNYFDAGIQFLEFKDPQSANGVGYVDPVFNIGFTQVYAIHFDYSIYSAHVKKTGTLAQLASAAPAAKLAVQDDGINLTAIKKSLPLSVLLTTKRKNTPVLLGYEDPDPASGFNAFILQRIDLAPNPLLDVNTPLKWEGVYLDGKDYFYTKGGAQTVGGIIRGGFYNSEGVQKAFGGPSFASRAALSEEVLPFFGDELLQNDAVADIKPVYNFVSPQWEKNMPLAEHMIGNIYTYVAGTTTNFIENSKFEFDTYGFKLKNCSLETMTLYQESAAKYSNIVFLDSIEKMNIKAETAKSQFPMYNEISFMPEVAGEIANLMKDTGIFTDFLKFWLGFDEHFGYAPYGKATPPSVNENEPIIRWGDYEEAAQGKYAVYLNKKLIMAQDLQISSEKKVPPTFPTNYVGDSKYTYRQRLPWTADFLKWLEIYIAENASEEELGDFTVTTKLETLDVQTKFFSNGEQITSELESKSVKMLKLMAFLPKFKQIILKNLKHIHDIYSSGNIESDLSYCETLYYEIEKRTVSGVGQERTIQSIWIPVSEISDYIKYIDTQVKYGTTYSYSIHEIKIAIGTKYRLMSGPCFGQDNSTTQKIKKYGQIAATIGMPHFPEITYGGGALDNNYSYTVVGNPNGTWFPIYYTGGDAGTTSGTTFEGSTTLEDFQLLVLEAEYQPQVYVTKVPLYEEDRVSIYDNPPMFPLCNIYPISGQKNKILITLENQTGDRDLIPIPIRNGDQNYFDTVRLYQRRQTKLPNGDFYNPTLRFKSEEGALSYEIYRITGEKPYTYSQFSKALHTTLDASTQSGFEDSISVNTKYYYMFRTIDRHKSISNPSPIFEVEMVEDSGVFYPIIKLCNFEFEKTYSESKRFRRYLMIDAADKQAVLNETETGIDGKTAVTGIDPVLGTAEKSIWNGKRFKFRIKSRDTGRVIDLNLSFQTKHLTNEEEKINLCD